MNSGFLIRKLGAIIIWALKRFKGNLNQIEENYYKYDFIIGFLFLCVIAYLIMKF
jgi:hypothetical protein